MVFIRTTEKQGACFIRTDQLDGETDWKLRLAIQNTQRLFSNVVCIKYNRKIVSIKHVQSDMYSEVTFRTKIEQVRQVTVYLRSSIQIVSSGP